VWRDGDTVRVPVRVDLTNTAIKEPEKRQEELLRLFELYFSSDVAATIIHLYEIDHNTILSAEEHRVARDRLIELVDTLDSQLIDTSINDENSRLTTVFDLSGGGLENRTIEIIEDVVAGNSI